MRSDLSWSLFRHYRSLNNMLCPHMSSEPINIPRGNIREGVSLRFGSVTPGSLIVWSHLAYCSWNLRNRDMQRLMNSLGGCEWETKERLSIGFSDLCMGHRPRRIYWWRGQSWGWPQVSQPRHQPHSPVWRCEAFRELDPVSSHPSL